MFTDQGLFSFDQTDNFDRILVLLQNIIRHRRQSGLKVSLSYSVVDRQEALWRKQKCSEGADPHAGMSLWNLNAVNRCGTGVSTLERISFCMEKMELSKANSVLQTKWKLACWLSSCCQIVALWANASMVNANVYLFNGTPSSWKDTEEPPTVTSFTSARQTNIFRPTGLRMKEEMVKCNCKVKGYLNKNATNPCWLIKGGWWWMRLCKNSKSLAGLSVTESKQHFLLGRKPLILPMPTCQIWFSLEYTASLWATWKQPPTLPTGAPPAGILAQLKHDTSQKKLTSQCRTVNWYMSHYQCPDSSFQFILCYLWQWENSRFVCRKTIFWINVNLSCEPEKSMFPNKIYCNKKRMRREGETSAHQLNFNNQPIHLSVSLLVIPVSINSCSAQKLPTREQCVSGHFQRQVFKKQTFIYRILYQEFLISMCELLHGSQEQTGH